MHDVQPVEPPEPWQVIPHDRRQVPGIVERAEVISIGRGVHRDPGLPVGQIDAPPVIGHQVILTERRRMWGLRTPFRRFSYTGPTLVAPRRSPRRARGAWPAPGPVARR